MANIILSDSICTRCGKRRVVTKTYEERVETSLVVYKITVCQDSECQKVVDKGLRAEKVKREFIRNEQERRELVRKGIISQRKILSSRMGPIV